MATITLNPVAGSQKKAALDALRKLKRRTEAERLRFYSRVEIDTDLARELIAELNRQREYWMIPRRQNAAKRVIEHIESEIEIEYAVRYCNVQDQIKLIPKEEFYANV